LIRALLVIGVLLAWPAAARAHDSLAPPGSTHNWLPDEEWVHRHWIPFDSQVLTRALGLRSGQLEAYLYNDHHTLAALAVAQGIDPEALADRLVAGWPEARRPRLRERTMRILTQGHLAQHMFFHLFHGLDPGSHAHHVFGMPSEEYVRLRQDGLTYREIAERGGHTTKPLQKAVIAMLERNRREGVAREQAWPAEADRILARTRARIGCWVRRPLPGWDKSNPYGKNRFLHGSHKAGWPATPEEWAADERRVERVRNELTRTCWAHVARYRGPAPDPHKLPTT
jgi:hypothetical protein